MNAKGVSVMWKKNTQLHDELVQIIENCFILDNHDSKETTSLEQKLRQFPATDAIAAILDDRVLAKLFSLDEGNDFNNWIQSIESWLNEVENPCYFPTMKDAILYTIWDRFVSDLADNLRRARVVAGIPTDGYVLAFIGCLSKCVILHYRFTGLIPKLKPKIVIDEPRSAFDIWDAIDSVDQKSKNYLKRVLTSGHKIISHRGILAHVDRRQENRVFGPSIDTVIMSEELARVYYEDFTYAETNNKSPKFVLEIGSGSGFLSAGIVRYFGSLERLVCIDIESTAIHCTEKNIKVALIASGTQKANISYTIGAFDSSRFQEKKLDLIICNPPYIPFPPVTNFNKNYTHNLEAVGGLELIGQILQELPKILAPEGKLLLMVNNLSVDKVRTEVPNGYKIDEPFGKSGCEIIFDVEDVLENEEWKVFLETRHGGRLYSKKNGEYLHRLHPLWISKS